MLTVRHFTRRVTPDNQYGNHGERRQVGRQSECVKHLTLARRERALDSGDNICLAGGHKEISVHDQVSIYTVNSVSRGVSQDSAPKESMEIGTVNKVAKSESANAFHNLHSYQKDHQASQCI